MIRHRERPHSINEQLMDCVNRRLPTELERNRLLNAYYVDLDQLLRLAAETSEGTFMNQLAEEYGEIHSTVRRLEAETEKERRRRVPLLQADRRAAPAPPAAAAETDQDDVRCAAQDVANEMAANVR